MKILLLILALCLSSCKEPIWAEELKASWYSIDSLKKEGTYKHTKGIMANGSWYDENALTCATRLYPFGSWLYITNLANSKSVIVRVTDRIGKRFAKSRIDLSKRAFYILSDGHLELGLIKVKIINDK